MVKQRHMSAQNLFASCEKFSGAVSLVVKNNTARRVTARSDGPPVFALQRKDRDRGLHPTVHRHSHSSDEIITVSSVH